MDPFRYIKKKTQRKISENSFRRNKFVALSDVTGASQIPLETSDNTNPGQLDVWNRKQEVEKAKHAALAVCCSLFQD